MDTPRFDEFGTGHLVAHRPNSVQHCAGPARRLREIGLSEQDSELLSAKPGQGVSGIEALLHPPSDFYQDLIADIVAEAVVDGLEVIDVHKGQSQGLTCIHPSLGLRHDGFKFAAVGKLRQTVCLGLLPQLRAERHHFAVCGLQGPFALDQVRHVGPDRHDAALSCLLRYSVPAAGARDERHASVKGPLSVRLQGMSKVASPQEISETSTNIRRRRFGGESPEDQ